MKIKCRTLFAYSEEREKQIYTACDMAGIDDEDIEVRVDRIPKGCVIIFITCNARQWRTLKHELKLGKFWI